MITIIVIFLLLIASALFSASETAFTTVSKTLIKELEKQGNKRAKIVNKIISNRKKLINTIILGNTLSNTFASVLVTSLLLKLFGESGIIYATILMTLFVLIFAEILPKTLALINATKIALFIAPIINFFIILFLPITSCIQPIINIFTVQFALNESRININILLTQLRGQIDSYINAIDDAPSKMHKKAMLINILELTDVTVEEVMEHRLDIFMVNADLPIKQIVNQITNSRYTRVPVWQNNSDNIIGIINAKTLNKKIRHLNDIDSLNLDDVMTPVWFIPETKLILNQLEDFCEQREKFCVVINEYGDIQGILTLEDILEEIIGEITDENETIALGIRLQKDGSYLISGDTPIRDLNKQFNWYLPDNNDYYSLAGLVIYKSKTIPNIGQKFRFNGLDIQIQRRTQNKITYLKVWPTKQTQLLPNNKLIS